MKFLYNTQGYWDRNNQLSEPLWKNVMEILEQVSVDMLIMFQLL